MTEHRAVPYLDLWDVVSGVVEQIRMPPGITVKLASKYDYDHVMLTIMGVWPDVNDPTRQTTTLNSLHLHPERFPPSLARADVREIVLTAIDSHARTLWLHEYDEWFTCEGRPFRDPHPHGPGFFV